MTFICRSFCLLVVLSVSWLFYIPGLYMYFTIIPIKFGIIVVTIFINLLWNWAIMCSKHITNTLPWEKDTLLNVENLPGFLETNLSQNSDLSLRFYSNLRKLKKMHFSKKNLAQILTQLEKKLKSPPHQT